MEIRILDSAYIYNFKFNTEEIRDLTKSFVIENLNKQKNTKLHDWTLYFYFRYNNVKSIMIYLKEKSLSSEKTKDITVHIPFPNKSQASWGVPSEDHVYKESSHLDHILKNFNLLEVDFFKFDNRQDYVFDCMKRSINYCFHKGFKVNGIEFKCK
ncbi:Imm9 family immunity protein [Pedobacter aquatilis]|uniref:Imm9 family immunity protein n=1 Tax=Pedobacter aquatilis TaxID=351343 RepID=UPI00292ECB28|nr:Imm9 family immunity protein [Pedobacter aquatilis]